MGADQNYRSVLADFIAREARPQDKFGHQPRLYALARRIAAGLPHDDDVLYAAAWLHDLGVFAGHRPEDPDALACWDHVAYTTQKAPEILAGIGFPEEKVPAVIEAIRSHQPDDRPATAEGVILRDADILEQLGAIGILRAVAKVGRDTRYPTFTAAVAALRRTVRDLPQRLALEPARRLAAPKVQAMRAFLASVAEEDQGALY